MFNLATDQFFSLFLEAVYPVGLTEVPLCLMREITCNCLNIDQIYPKFDTDIRLLTPNTRTKFQPDWNTNAWVIEIYAKRAKRWIRGPKKKRRIVFQKLIARISGMAEGIFFKFYMWPLLNGGHLHCKFGAIWIRNHGATDAWKSQLCCSCQYITPSARPPFSWATQHTAIWNAYNFLPRYDSIAQYVFLKYWLSTNACPMILFNKKYPPSHTCIFNQ